MVNLMEQEVESIQWVHSQGNEILRAEFSQKTEEDALSMMEKFVTELSCRESRSVLLLADLNHAVFLPGVAFKWQDHQGLIHSKCGKIALVGAHQIIEWTAKSIIHLAEKAGWRLEDKVRFFDYADQAIRWLTVADPHSGSFGSKPALLTFQEN